MVASKTLLIRHMPSELTSEEKEDFLKHFGALNVKIFGSKSKKTNNVFAVFETHEAADAALKRLHQTELFGQLLAVEFARGEEISADINAHSYEYEKINPDKKKDKTQKYYENFLYRLSSWASEVDFNIPPPVHLKYQYPPPSSNVLENIAKALANVPKFYTQVLHLMNKMNLPCPFMDPYPIETDLFGKNVYNIFHKETVVEESKKDVSSSPDEESEIESDENESILNKNIIPSKRHLPEKKRQTKRMKFIKPTTNKFPTTVNKNLLKAEEVFEVSDKEPIARKIEVKITPDLSSIQEAEETQKLANTVEGFEKLPVSENISGEEEKQNQSPKDEEAMIVCITEQELAANRIPARDQKILPVFKNYQPGVPSCRLYIKNLAKQVQARDLHYIYRRYMIPDQEEQGMMFDIRLMQEGRMKGQAFINLQNVELAQKALNETNGFILKDKPMVVQFARSSKAK